MTLPPSREPGCHVAVRLVRVMVVCWRSEQDIAWFPAVAVVPAQRSSLLVFWNRKDHLLSNTVLIIDDNPDLLDLYECAFLRATLSL